MPEISIEISEEQARNIFRSEVKGGMVTLKKEAVLLRTGAELRKNQDGTFSLVGTRPQVLVYQKMIEAMS